MERDVDNFRQEEEFYFAVKLIIFIFFVVIFCFMYCLVSRYTKQNEQKSKQFRSETLTSIAVIS